MLLVGELGSEGAKLCWPSFIMFLCLPLTICLFLVLTSLSLLDWSRPPLRQVELGFWETCNAVSLVRAGLLGDRQNFGVGSGRWANLPRVQVQV